MHRFVWRSLMLAALLVFTVPQLVEAQSKREKGGPMVEIDGSKSQVFKHWKLEKSEKPVMFKFSLGKTKDLDKLDDATLVIEPIKGTKEEIFSSLKKEFDEKAVDRTDAVKAGKLKGDSLFLTGTYTKGTKPAERYRMYAVVLDTKDGKVLVKLLGPGAVVGLHQPDLKAFLEDFK